MQRRIALLALLLVLACVGMPVGATPINLTSKNTTVEIAGYIPIVSATSTVSAAPRSFINSYNPFRMRQNVNITNVSFFYQLRGGSLTWAQFETWRYVGPNWTRMTTNSVSTVLVNNTASIVNLDVPVPVLEGDWIVLNISAPGATAVLTAVGSSGGGTVNYTATPSSSYNWLSASTLVNTILPVKAYGQSPIFVGIGDSIMAGHPDHYSYIENGTYYHNNTIQIMAYLSEFQGGKSYQNMGIGSQTTTNMKDRFTSDVVNLSPNVVIIEGGVNDLAGGTISEATYLSNIMTMVNISISNGTTPIVMTIAPWTGGSNANMYKRDTWTTDLKSNVSLVPGAYYVDVDNYVGQFRAAGPAGNLWDINTSYNADGVHFNGAGYLEYARAISDKINAVNTAAITATFTPSGPITLQYPAGQIFTDTSTGSPTAWDWNWGDGTHCYTQNCYKQWYGPGVYTVNLTVNSTLSDYSSNTTVVNVMRSWWRF